MEARGSRPGEMSEAIHYGGPWPRNPHQSRTHHFQTGRTIADMNEHAVEWNPGEIRWYVNAQQFFKATQWHGVASDGKPRPFPAPFDQPFHIIVNLVLGGHFDGRPEPAASFIPAELEVEYVRAYRRISAPGAVGDHPSTMLNNAPTTRGLRFAFMTSSIGSKNQGSGPSS